jgi:hypothetical protein
MGDHLRCYVIDYWSIKAFLLTNTKQGLGKKKKKKKNNLLLFQNVQ